MNKKQATYFYISFAVTIFLGAFLLFQIQPVIGKYILPWFGGTSFVWITSLLFFQALLLGGYFYSFLITKLSLKTQLLFHSLLVIAIGLTTLGLFFFWTSPITPGVDTKLSDTVSPVLQVLAVLLISVGLPYFLLSTTSTLLQKWFSILPHKKSPYPLYALSNIGSLLAIITYPFLIEPFLPIQNQGQIWSVVFITFCLLLLLCIFQMFKHRQSENLSNVKAADTTRKTAVTKQQIKLWLVLPAISSIVLLAGTHQLTQSIAPIPFLWLLPLGLYLLSFILCFSEQPFYKRNFYAYAYLLIVPFVLTVMLYSPLLGVLPELTFYTIMFFSCFMLCHGELFDKRPSPQHLNTFYLLMSAGSVIGSLIVAIIAPLFFVGLFWEFMLGLLAASILAVLVLVYYKNSKVYRLFTFLLIGEKETKVTLVGIVVAFFGILAVGIYNAQHTASSGIWRNFYGTLRILDDTELKTRCLLNGKIIHGCQPTNPADRMKPTAYFGENSIGLAISSLREHTDEKLRMGIIGLGIGTLATYGREGEYVKFYELNPVDADIAKTHFSYITKTPAKVETVIGDGRLSLEKELQANKKQHFHIFIVDAFNDDAIPVHLLTQEAIALYKAHLAEKGIIAIHISNSYLDLTPVVEQAAAYHKMHILIIDAPATNKYQTRSKWALLTANPELLHTAALKKAKKAPSGKQIRVWTDDYSNLFQIVKYLPN